MATAFPDKKDFGTAAADIRDKAQETATEAASKAKDLAATVSQKVGEAASFVGKKAEDATAAMGAGMKNLGGTIREHAPGSGMAGSATSAVADSLESGGRYLQDHGLSGIGADLATLIRRNPIPAVLIGLGAGFLLARATTVRS
jgi:hypothetical protein